MKCATLVIYITLSVSVTNGFSSLKLVARLESLLRLSVARKRDTLTLTLP